eukprot:5732103-Lingulodinium_polyedra.AAC.1
MGGDEEYCLATNRTQRHLPSGPGHCRHVAGLCRHVLALTARHRRQEPCPPSWACAAPLQMATCT